MYKIIQNVIIWHYGKNISTAVIIPSARDINSLEEGLQKKSAEFKLKPRQEIIILEKK